MTKSPLRILLLAGREAVAQLRPVFAATSPSHLALDHAASWELGVRHATRHHVDLLVVDGASLRVGASGAGRLAETTPILLLTSNGMGQQAPLLRSAEYHIPADQFTPTRLQPILRRLLRDRQRRNQLRTAVDTVSWQRQELARHSMARDAFADRMQREMRGPLAAMERATAMLAVGITGAADAKTLSSVSEDLLHYCGEMNRTLVQLGDIAQLRSGRLTARRRAVSVAQLLHGLLPTLGSTLLEQHCQLHVELTANLPRVWCDPQQCERALTYLVAGVLEASTECHDIILAADVNQAGGGVQLSVRTKADHVQRHACRQLLQQARSQSLNADAHDTGTVTGLGIADGYLEQHFGRLLVGQVDEPHNGFRFSLPAAEPAKLVRSFLQQPLLQRPTVILSQFVVSAGLKPAQGVPRELDELLQNSLAPHDLLYPLTANQWSLLMDTTHIEPVEVFRNIRESWRQVRQDRAQAGWPKLTLAERGSWELGENADAIADQFMQLVRAAQIAGGEADLSQLPPLESDQELVRPGAELEDESLASLTERIGRQQAALKRDSHMLREKAGSQGGGLGHPKVPNPHAWTAPRVESDAAKSSVSKNGQ